MAGCDDLENGPLVTIGISTHNRARTTLRHALDSALAQTYPRVEVLVCDNASSDNTEALLRSLTDGRLRYFRHPENIGANANFNFCLAQARGLYFILLHDDDVLDPTFVERAMRARNDREPGVLLSGVRLIDFEGNVRGESGPPSPSLTGPELFLHWFDKRFSFYLVSTLYHTEHLRQAGGFNSPESLFQDVIATARLVGRHGYVSVPGIGGSFRIHEASRTARTSRGESLRWLRDSVCLLDVLCEEMPEEKLALRKVGSRYLTATCYRRAAAERSWWRRREYYNEIFLRFGRSLHPWRYVASVRTRRLKRFAGRVLLR